MPVAITVPVLLTLPRKVTTSKLMPLAAPNEVDPTVAADAVAAIIPGAVFTMSPMKLTETASMPMAWTSCRPDPAIAIAKAEIVPVFEILPINLERLCVLMPVANALASAPIPLANALALASIRPVLAILPMKVLMRSLMPWAPAAAKVPPLAIA